MSILAFSVEKCIFLNYCLHEETISLDQLTSVGQTFSENDVTTDASLLLEETYQEKGNEQHNQTYILEEQSFRNLSARVTATDLRNLCIAKVTFISVSLALLLCAS